jgi:hypothetical protein
MSIFGEIFILTVSIICLALPTGLVFMWFYTREPVAARASRSTAAASAVLAASRQSP